MCDPNESKCDFSFFSEVNLANLHFFKERLWVWTQVWFKVKVVVKRVELEGKQFGV